MSLEVEKPLCTETTKRFERQDSLIGDAEKVSNIKGHGSEGNWTQVLHLAFQSIGIIYGDVGTSPLYCYSSTFPNGVKDKDDILGVLSLILYTLILLPMIKYVFIVLYADDNGDGGTFALYSLISRYSKIRLIPNQQAEDSMVSNYSIESPSLSLKRAQWLKEKLESSKAAKIGLFTITILGTSMVMGDGTLTPAISVLSAVSGIKEKVPSLTETQIVWISVPILFMLFSVQRFGTDKVGYSFAPIISVWFVLIAGIGMYNIVVYEITILRAFNPMHIIYYFERNGKEAWISLGGAILCVTGTEGMYADLGHFNITAIQISFNGVLFPSVALCYMGQAAYLRKFPENVADTFYRSLPAPLFWPTFTVAILSAIIASQAMLSGAFAILSKALSLGCFPRVRVIHTSKHHQGQVYIPEVNFLMGLASVIITITFRTTTEIGNAYGICVVTVFSITTHLMTIVMLLVWKKNIIFILLFYVVFSSVEWIYLSSILSKFIQGGYLPFCFALVLMALMVTWHYVHVMTYWYELDHIVPIDEVTALLEKHNVQRIPGVGILYSELVQGIPPVFLRLVEKIPSVHSIFLFMSIKHLPIPHVAPAERFVFRQVGPREHRMFRCVARYGYSDGVEDSGQFARFLADRLKMFIEDENAFAVEKPENEDTDSPSGVFEGQTNPRKSARSVHSEEVIEPPMSNHVGRISSYSLQTIEEEKRLIDAEMKRGVVYLMGSANVIAGPESPTLKVVVVDYVYSFLRRNLAEGHKVLSIPKDQLLKVGITYEI
ncbi:potassium transporter 19-like isoform X2 [Triticum dicoccoides]|uniref:potassium transporter 19-like isoform X2 n=1 Tax=Triticum dicoccoides TaxID=85692 RepID=UPI000E7B6775|nr:potassium transporter 19-like isoform X2 [Triticum dicoccoides]